MEHYNEFVKTRPAGTMVTIEFESRFIQIQYLGNLISSKTIFFFIKSPKVFAHPFSKIQNLEKRHKVLFSSLSFRNLEAPN